MEGSKEMFHEMREGEIGLPQIALDRKSISQSATNVINSVKEGNVNPLDIATKIKALEELIKEIKEGIKSDVLTEAAKHGKNASFNSSTISIKEAGIKYDYSSCNDAEWADLKERLSAREKFLKGLDKPIETFNKETGEVFTICPPVKSSATTYQIELPKS